MLNRDYKFSFAVTKLPYIDVGTPRRWLAANKHILTSSLSNSVNIGNNTKIKNCSFKGPVVVGDNVELTGSEIGPYVSIGDNSSIIESRVASSLCLENSNLYRVQISDQLVGPQTLLNFNI